LKSIGLLYELGLFHDDDLLKVRHISTDAVAELIDGLDQLLQLPFHDFVAANEDALHSEQCSKGARNEDGRNHGVPDAPWGYQVLQQSATQYQAGVPRRQQLPAGTHTGGCLQLLHAVLQCLHMVHQQAL